MNSNLREILAKTKVVTLRLVSARKIVKDLRPFVNPGPVYQLRTGLERVQNQYKQGYTKPQKGLQGVQMEIIHSL